VSNLKRFLGVCLCVSMVVGASFGQKITKVIDASSPYIKGAKPMFVTIPAPNLKAGEAPQGTQVPLWSGSFVFNQQTFNFTMVGTAPTQGSVTSSIPLVIIPIKFAFSDGTKLSASQTVCGDVKNTKYRVKNSPLLKNTTFTPGGTNVGKTQYEDAFQRANFWNTVSTTAPNYHVLFGPVSFKPLQTINVGANGSTVAGPCARIGEVDINFFDNIAQGLVSSLGIPATSLPLFLDYNTFWTQGGGCCVLGYHFVTPANHTYSVAAYTDPGIFNVPIEDIHALSHELGEWMDDPFGNNIVPAWGHVGQVGGCQSNLEVGDPVTGNAFTVTTGGAFPFTYHPEDLVFFPWFARIKPSTSVNGWFTFLNGFSAPQAVCH
jgi:hypothetical protein